MRQNWSILSSDAKEIHLFSMLLLLLLNYLNDDGPLNGEGWVSPPMVIYRPVRLDHNDLNYA